MILFGNILWTCFPLDQPLQSEEQPSVTLF